jgi:2-keto-4-pentenoate hydratase/2-oxohepta-3-ene-1,7-dioic acid hydratase in catechol pathway
MKLATFTHGDRTRLGQIIGDEIYEMAWPDSMLAAVRRGMTPSRGSIRFKLDDVKFEAPLRPGKIIAIGLNYADHARETGKEIPDHPLVFAKFPSSVIGDRDAITWKTSITDSVDWEAELAVIIGKKAHEVSEEQALDYVFGYTVGNDVSARDLQNVKDRQWTRGKSLDTFCPLGPWVVTRDEIADPHNLSIKTTINDKVVQDSNTSNLIFNIPFLVSYLSQNFTLDPGDVIMTGTPPGVGAGMKPPTYLKDGDVVSVTIEQIGTITNPCVAKEA